MRVVLAAVSAVAVVGAIWPGPVSASAVAFTTGDITRLAVNVDPDVTIGSTGWSPTAWVRASGDSYQPDLWVRNPGTVYLEFSVSARVNGEIASDACQFSLWSGTPARLVASFGDIAYQSGGEFGFFQYFDVSVLESGPLLARVDCGSLGTAQTRFSNVTLVPAAPRGDFVGVSINGGDLATNSTEVLLDLDWRTADLFDKVMVSNDGGFGSRKEFVLDGKPLRWALRAAGSERLPKTVYVRFHSPYSGEWTPAASDDIILDTVAPVITSAEAAQPRSKTRKVTVRLTAKDDRSGVVSTQFRVDKNRSLRVVDYAKTVTVTVPRQAKVLQVRVRDGAGNWSRWKNVA
jgi:hypothetical protein